MLISITLCSVLPKAGSEHIHVKKRETIALKGKLDQLDMSMKLFKIKGKSEKHEDTKYSNCIKYTIYFN